MGAKHPDTASSPPAGDVLAQAIDSMLASAPPRAGSLAITIFGDTISRHGNSVWLGSLVGLLEQFGLNARQVRTAVYRLGREGWLTSEQVGRRSYLSLSASGLRHYERAAQRIYAVGSAPWDGRWTLVTPAGLGGADREALRRELGWLGFGPLSNGVLAHPRADDEALRETMEGLDATDRVVVWRAEAEHGSALEDLVRDCWQLDVLAERFDAFIAKFRGLLGVIADAPSLAPREALRARTLLIHEYRRILLRTNELPEALLPRRWPGHEAMHLAAALYRAVQAPATDYARAALHGREGTLPRADASYFERFGGLAARAAAASAA